MTERKPPARPQTPFERRLLFVVGKGGVGKTTVAGALALAALRRKRRVLLVEMEFEDRICPLLGVAPVSGNAPVEILSGLFRMRVEGRAALEEYLGMVVPVRRVLRAIFENRVYQHFVAAAPGLKELMTVGKIWFEVEQGRWDLVIVDCPATGHSLQYLRMPKAAYETFTTGLVNREAKRVWGLLHDPRATAVSIVTTAEEMPVNETLEICRQLHDDLDLAPGWMFVNRFHSPQFSRAEVEQARAVVGRNLAPPAAALAAEVLSRAEGEAGWGMLNEANARRLEAESAWRLLRLPFIFREEFGLPDVEELSHRIEEGIEGLPKARDRREIGAAER